MLCCSDPQLLSQIAAASAQDLEPVRLESLSATNADGDFGPPLLGEQPGAGLQPTLPLQPQHVSLQQTQNHPQMAVPQRPAAQTGLIPVSASDLGPGLADFGQPSGGRAQTGGMEAYELARRLVNSAAASGSAGGSGAGGAGVPGSYTSAARKVRVSVKIPDREPEELPPNWEADLRINGQREAALVLFTYMRRGCVQLVVDVLRRAPQHQPQQGAGSAGATRQREHDGASASARSTTATDSGQAVSRAAALQLTTEAGSGVVSGMQEALSAAGLGQLMAGRTLTVQVDSTVSRVHVSEQAGSTASGDAAPAGVSQAAVEDNGDYDSSLDATPPPGVQVWPAVVCCGGGSLWRSAQRTVQLTCSWSGKAAAAAAAAAHGTTGGKLDTSSFEPPGSASAAAGSAEAQQHESSSEICITARQQGHFLPVHISHSRTAAGASGTQQEPSSVAPPVPWAVLSDGGCCLELAPCSQQGLVQVEMCRGGVHSNAASVLLLESPAATNELQQQLLLCTADEVAASSAPGRPQGQQSQSAAVQHLLRDFGVFLDIVAQLGLAEARGSRSGGCKQAGSGSLSIPAACGTGTGNGRRVELITWALPPAGSRSRAPVADRLLLAPLACRTAKGDAAAQPGHLAESEQAEVERARRLADMGCDVGLNLLRHFLAAGMPACAGTVLDLLADGLDVTASSIAAYRCCDGLSLMHHAARSGQLPPLATLAAWLEVRGVAPGWSTPAGAAALSPLHLLAATPDSCDAASTQACLQLRWPEVAGAWRSAGTERGGCGATPAQFAAMTADAGTGKCVKAAFYLASNTASVMGVGAAWRLAARAQRHVLSRSRAQAARDVWCQSQRFGSPELEYAYSNWLTRRTSLFDHSFLGLYMAHALLHMVTQGWAVWVQHNKAGLLLVFFRLALLVLSFSGGGSSSGGRGAPSSWLLQTREGRAVVLEMLRSLLMVALAAGLLEMPALWARVVTSKADIVFNIVMRPLAGQMRLGSSALCSLLALVGETAIMAFLVWGAQRSAMARALAVLAAMARSAITHSLGLGVTVLLQASLRKRFLQEERRRLLKQAQSQHAQALQHAGSSGGKVGAK
ncbi:hypothetical protein HYH02_006951 [Chlamydomonas schloesseri]|uniref:Uncharacterized protein n=1 Tax=Chlamydomonas schloesseri TaxID=2026947 RepID=A0A835WJH6_9CHLO|nr:hypothetical protein HYH02_006951 [Chlamydomonas schloesseri]|eukprot:KAG2448369.1 hypothetical protein HYH02_006951 [Chlamydomonas schloesseri]